MYQNYYRDKVVLITGGSMGIGKKLAEQILQFGGSVVITGRNAARLEAFALTHNGHAAQLMTACLDVADEAGLKLLILAIQQRFGRLDVLVNNAAISAYGDLENTASSVIHTVIDTNIKGLLFTTQAALPLLHASRGTVLFVSSLAGLYGLPGYSLYALSKMALSALRQSLASELANRAVFPAIAYIGFTSNESEKRTLNAEGEMEAVPARSARLTFSREETATLLLQQIARKRKVVIQGKLGKLTYFLARYFPTFLHFLLDSNYRKTNQKRYD